MSSGIYQIENKINSKRAGKVYIYCKALDKGGINHPSAPATMTQDCV